jgi:nucleoside-diphosphate-sugar epimerase
MRSTWKERTLLECALKSGICRVIHLSTYAIRAKCADVPFNEESQISQLHMSEYGRSKLLGDRVAWEF